MDRAGKILLDSSGSVLAATGSGYSYSGLHWPSGSVGYSVYTTGGPLGAGAAVRAGFQPWNGAGAAFSFVYGGGGVNAVSWGPIDGPGGTLAITYIYYRASSNIIYECQTTFDTAESWGTDGSASKYDVQNVAAHESGHWLSLDDLYQDQYSDMTMYGYASLGETKKRTLAWGDIAGIQFIYPPSTVTVKMTQVSTEVSTLYTSGTTTATSTSYTSTTTSTSTIPALTTVVLVPLSMTSTVQSTQYETSFGTTTVTSYTSTSTSTSTTVVYTTVTVLGAAAASSSPLAYFGFISLLAAMVGQRVTASKGRRIPKVESRIGRRCSTS